MRQLLSDAIEDFMVLRASQDYSRKTLNNERGVLKRFLLVNGNIWVNTITETQAIRHFEQASKTRAPDSLRQDHTTLNQFFEWARRSKRMPLDVDPMATRRRPKSRKRERQRIPVTQFPQLLDIAEERDPRDRAICAVFLYTLIRDQECANLLVGDWKRDEGWLRVQVTKSGMEDEMPVCSELDTELRRWVTHYSVQLGRPLQPQDYLLPRRRSAVVLRENGRIIGHEMRYVAEQKLGRMGTVVKEILGDFGLPLNGLDGKPLSEGAHTLRRSGARALFDRLAADGVDRSLRLVQSMLHHKSVMETEKYLGLTADRLSRDDMIRLKPMFPASSENVVALSV